MNDTSSGSAQIARLRLPNPDMQQPPSASRDTERTPLLQAQQQREQQQQDGLSSVNSNAVSTQQRPRARRSASSRSGIRRSKRRSLACRVAIGLALAASFLAVVVLVLFIVVARSATSGILLHLFSSLGGLRTCSECYLILGGIRQLALLGDNTFTNTFTSLCIDLRIQPADVCKGALSRQGPVIAQSLRRIQPNRYTAAVFCSKMFGLCDSHVTRTQDWPESVFPPPANHKPRRRKRSGKTKKIVHIADIHVDREYKPGTEGKCGRVLCCREPPQSGGLLGPSKVVSPAGEYGHPACDTPFSLLNSLLEAVQEVAGDAVGVLSTGDIPSHAVWEESKESVSRDVLDVYSLMRSRLAMPVYGSIGNHDVSPVNLFPPSWNARLHRNGEWIYELHHLAWESWLGHSVSRSSFVERSGCYSVIEPTLGIRIISLNTNFWSADNFYLYDSEALPQDPEQILRFLIDELHAAEAAGQPAYIVGHASPAGFLPAQSHYFNQIVQRYHRTVAGQFYGHTHRTEVAVGYADNQHKTTLSANAVAYTAGSVTPFGGTVNPTFRVYDVDTGSGEIWDWTDYFANISDPGFQKTPVWQPLYSVRSEFGSVTSLDSDQPLTPSFWHAVSEALATSRQLFRRYVFLRYGGSPFGAYRACKTEACWNYSICSMRRMRKEDRCDTSYARNATLASDHLKLEPVVEQDAEDIHAATVLSMLHQLMPPE